MRGRFGKIDYLNLLPFDFFIKSSKYNYLKRSLIKAYPAKITDMFLKRAVDAAFISSIASKRKRCLDVGIVADGEVLSVLLCEGEDKDDRESKSSNRLKRLLGLKGEVVIGDKALKLYFEDKERCLDLAKEWKKVTGLPFVFALFCVNSNTQFYQKVLKRFIKSNIKIPYYIKKEYSVKLDLPIKLIELYLQKISYCIGYNEKKAIKLFLKDKKLKRQ